MTITEIIAMWLEDRVDWTASVIRARTIAPTNAAETSLLILMTRDPNPLVVHYLQMLVQISTKPTLIEDLEYLTAEWYRSPQERGQLQVLIEDELDFVLEEAAILDVQRPPKI